MFFTEDSDDYAGLLIRYAFLCLSGTLYGIPETES